MPLTTQQLEQYQRDGYAVGERLLTEAELTGLRSEMDRVIAALPAGARPENIRGVHEASDFLMQVCLSERLVAIAEQILGPDPLLLSTYAISKPPAEGLQVDWHQDAYYFAFSPMEIFTLWLAVDDSDRDNGCMRVVAGSHRGRVIHAHGYDDGWGRTTTLPLSLAGYDARPAVDVELQAGAFSVHDPYIVHGSAPNRSNRRRCGITILYVTPRLRIDPAYDSPMKIEWTKTRLYHCSDRTGRTYHYPEV